jgi:hypothetical protein
MGDREGYQPVTLHMNGSFALLLHGNLQSDRDRFNLTERRSQKGKQDPEGSGTVFHCSDSRSVAPKGVVAWL